MFCCQAGAVAYPKPCPWHGEFSVMEDLPQATVIVRADDRPSLALTGISMTTAATMSLDTEPWWQVGVAAAWHASVLVAFAGETV